MSPEELLRKKQMLKLVERTLKIKQAQDDLISLAELLMPSPSDPDDVNQTRYDAQPFHRALAKALMEVEAGDYQKLIITLPPRHGKQCAHSTPVLTTEGWKTHGDLKPGDYVFGPDGAPTRVVAVSEETLADVEMEFSNGEVVKCHRNHEWVLWRRESALSSRWQVFETRRLLEPSPKTGAPLQLWDGARGKRGGRMRYQLPNANAVRFDAADQPMPPYVLGVWLGDGSTKGPYITMSAADEAYVMPSIEAAGYPQSRRWVHATTKVPTVSYGGSRNKPGRFARDLKTIGLGAGKEKHIPQQYLRGSVAQRLELLAGLVDTDGHVCRKTGRIRIVTGNERLKNDIVDLCSTLGFRPYVHVVEPTTSSSGIVGRKVVFYVGFQPNIDVPTRIPRKRSKAVAVRRRVGVSDVRWAAEPEAGRCIQVDRADGLYLVGKTLIPTHNSEMASKTFPAWFVGRDPYRHVMVASYNQPFANDFGKAVRDIMGSEVYKKVFPDCKLKRGSKAADRLQTESGGVLAFVGRGGSITGRGANLFIIDDPLKNSKEAGSETIREECWTWFNNDVLSRGMDDTARMLIIMCMAGDTPVLMASGREKPLRDVRPGDRVATYENDGIAVSTVRNWINHGPDRVFEIRMKSGTVVKANARHPFLVEENGERQWRRTATLKRGSVILRATRVGGLRTFFSPLRSTYEIERDVVVDVVDGGSEDVFDIQVDRTENFIAGGLVSHNTRWHEDDLVGRITDPENVHYNAEEAKEWKIINIPALCEDETSDVEIALGRKKGDALWPYVHKWINGVRVQVPKIRREWLLGRMRQDPRGFASLYQQRPTPMDGDLIKDEMIKTYRMRDRPDVSRLRIYAASDHAAEEKTNNDYNVLLVVGVDKDDVIWVLDVWWERAASDRVVEQMIRMMRKWKPITWYMEREHIVKTIGPFLRKRMREEKVYCVINDKLSAHTSDKVGKAQSIMGRMSMGMVMYPKDAAWFDKARTQMLKFPKATHDDFVDAMSTIGRALSAMLTGSKSPEDKKEPVAGTWGFFTAQRKVAERQAARHKNLRGM